MRVRREHMGRSSTGMGKNAQVRCVAEGFQARLLFEGQVRVIRQFLRRCWACFNVFDFPIMCCGISMQLGHYVSAIA